MCDIIYASTTAKFGQPEIKLGTLPGAGGSQRLTHAIGKSKSMELILSGTQPLPQKHLPPFPSSLFPVRRSHCVGKNLSSEDALRLGLIAALFQSPEECISASLDLAETIAGYSPLAVAAAKEAVNTAFEEGLNRGLEMERRLFWASFATEDRKIGMEAFVNKEKPKWVSK
jgi:enoyl-CoA hydratase